MVARGREAPCAVVVGARGAAVAGRPQPPLHRRVLAGACTLLRGRVPGAGSDGAPAPCSWPCAASACRLDTSSTTAATAALHRIGSPCPGRRWPPSQRAQMSALERADNWIRESPVVRRPGERFRGALASLRFFNACLALKRDECEASTSQEAQAPKLPTRRSHPRRSRRSIGGARAAHRSCLRPDASHWCPSERELC